MIVCSLEQIYNERAVQTLRPSPAQKNTLREFLVNFFIRICLYKFAHWFSSIFQSLQMYCRVFCNLTDSSRLLASKKQKFRKSLSSQPKIKPTTCGYPGPGILEKPKILRLFSHKKKA